MPLYTSDGKEYLEIKDHIVESPRIIRSTVSLLKDKKAKLEKEVAELLEKFTKETGLKISSMESQPAVYYEEDGTINTGHYSIYIEVQL